MWWFSLCSQSTLFLLFFQMKTILMFEDSVFERLYATVCWDKQGRTSSCEPWEFLALVTLIYRLYLLSFPLKQTLRCPRKSWYWIVPFKLLIPLCILLCRQLLLVTSICRNRKVGNILLFKCKLPFCKMSSKLPLEESLVLPSYTTFPL